ncbi:MAG: hypothetical protein IJ005_02980 [Bacteroidales bacterium]|nr:hypothetical protein [Bacteroidales bacterium]
MKRILVILVLSVASLTVSEVCHAQFSRLSIGKYGISSIYPESFRAVNGSVWLEVTNPMEGFTVSDVQGVVYKDGTPFVTGSTSDFHIASGSGRRTISGRAALCDGVSLWTVLSLLSFDPNDYSVDLSLRITMDSGQSRVVTKTGLPLKTLLKLR